MNSRHTTNLVASALMAACLASTAFANGERRTGIQIDSGAFITWCSEVTTFRLADRAKADAVTSAEAAPSVGFSVTVEEGPTRSLAGGSTNFDVANPGQDPAMMRAIRINVLFLVPSKGWVSVCQGNIGDPAIFRDPLPRKQGGRRIDLVLANACGRPFGADALPAIGARSKARFRLSGKVDVTDLIDAKNGKMKIETTAAFAITERHGRGCGCGCAHKERIAEAKTTRQLPVPQATRTNGRVLLAALLSALPDASVASTGDLVLSCLAPSGEQTNGLLPANGAGMFTTMIAATGRPGARTVVTASAPVRFVPGRRGSTAIALTAALAGSGAPLEGIETISGNPAVASCALISTGLLRQP